MMRLYFNILMLFFSLNSLAQKNRVSVSLNTFTFTRVKIDVFDTLDNKLATELFTQVRILPSIGYYRVLKNKLGVGCEIGYQQSKYTRIRSQDVMNNMQKDEHYDPSNIVYLCPSIFESYFIKKYQIISSISLPFQVQSRQKSSFTQTFTDKINGTEQVFKSINTFPASYTFGAYINLGLSRKIFKSTYLGAQIGIGISMNTMVGKGSRYSSESLNGIIVEESLIDQYFDQNIRGGANFRPIIFIHHNF